MTAESKPNRFIVDAKGQPFELTGRVGAGGQGVVCTTSVPTVLAKVVQPGLSEERRVAWINRIRSLIRRPLDGLSIAGPLALALHPKSGNPVGYLMELMDGLVSLTDLIETARGEGAEGYARTGGLRKRLRLLARLARTLSDLHGRGLAYGDLSPANVFVSSSAEHAEVWLIDADNIDSQSTAGSQRIHTPDYGAPEILKEEAGVGTLTDSWSFGVLAFRLLTLEHPLKGDPVLDGEPDMEERALRGEFPWIDHPEDRSNGLSFGIPREVVLDARLRALFGRCFGPGLHDPGARPSLAEWAAGLDAAVARLVDCEACGSAFHVDTGLECPFCGHIQPQDSVVLLRSFFFVPPDLLPADLPEDARWKESWTPTDDRIVLSRRPVELRHFPPGSSLHAEARLACNLRLAADGLWIEPTPGGEVNLQAASGTKVARIAQSELLKTSSRSGARYLLHLGPLAGPHMAWRFSW